jgi:thiosulfate/3-mercaptopyruvate sulfurtransferase
MSSGSGSVQLLDCRPREAYLAGHVPGAAHLDPEAALTGAIGDESRGRHPLPEAAAFAEAAGLAGLDAATFALAYDEGTGWAQRAWWLLRHFGHDAAGTFDLRTYRGRLAQGGERPAARRFVARERGDDTIGLDEVRARLDDPALTLLDARSLERWRGDTEPLDPVAGRIPGAVNAYFEAPLPEGAAEAEELAVYCGSGVTACVPLQQLILAGRGDARLYPGSFSEWCRNDLPIERGDA